MNLFASVSKEGSTPDLLHLNRFRDIPAKQNEWLHLLRADLRLAAEPPAADPELIDGVVRQLGKEPVEWALQTGASAAIRVAAMVTPLANDPTLRACAEAVTLTALLRLLNPDTPVPALTDDGVRYVRNAAAAAISSEDLANSIRVGHAAMSDGFLTACDALATPDRRTQSLRSVSATLFDHVDRFARAATRTFDDERARISASPAAARSRTVQRLLDSGSDRDAPRSEAEIERIGAVLEYSLLQTHQAVVISSTQNTRAEGTSNLRSFAYRLAQAAHARQHLVHFAGDEVWVWLGGPCREINDLGPFDEHQHHTEVSVGTRTVGVEGFISTLQQARDVRELRTRAVHPPQIWCYRDIELALLLAHDRTRAVSFVANRLSGLLTRDRHTDELRHTLKTYLDAHSSPNEAAQRLFLARNTVSARVRKAFDRLAADPGGDTLDLHAALLLVDIYGDSVLPDT